MIHPREFAKLCLFYSQEIALDVATPGKVAHDRAVTNAKLLKDATESWVSYCGWKPEDLMKEVWNHDQEAYKRHIERTRAKAGAGRKKA